MSGAGEGGGLEAFRFLRAIKHFYVLPRLFDFEISREFWANPHITVIYAGNQASVRPVLGDGHRGSSPPKPRDSLKFQIYTRRPVIILILTPGREAICSFRPFRALHGGLICQAWLA